MYRSTPWILLVGLVLAGCPEDLTEPEELPVARPTPDGPPTPPPPVTEIGETATEYTGVDAAWMTINSKPWGLIYLDGKRVGNTPKREYAIAPGEHEITVRCGPCIVDDEVSWSFTVGAKQHYTHIRTQFGESQPEVDHDFRHPEPDPDDGPDLSGGVVQPYKEADAGFLTLNSKPWSHVYMDGAYLGNTPKKRYEVAPGTHKLKLVCGACATEQIHELEFIAVAEETFTEVRIEHDEGR